CMQSMEFPFTF
nr:immunoglobulin light chain junction region [Macaca mulatta]MOV34285.1 immunoglobulin light chain junction region [Macaca mulatta]MOV34318.1 immunoglobulin light chain junction region [Macaca mulatta]MOV34455.1 immunoglobulin light chain junction region [Macaca mulatta]MOV34816.1 immunoglobulin light chain junction region [Macaca mulatta]